MRFTSEDAFRKALGGGGGAYPVYLLYGSENYLIEAYAKKLASPYTGGFSSFNLQRFDGGRLDMEALWEAVTALPLMADKKCVRIDDLDPARLSADELGTLRDILAGLAGDCTVLITARAPGFDARSSAGKKLVQLADEFGCAVELGARNQGGLVRFLQSAAKKNGCEIAPGECRYLAELCGGEMHTLLQELRKACAYAGGGPVTRAQIDAVAVPKTEARVFDLGRAILAGNPQKAMELVGDLFYLREKAPAILAVLVLLYTDLYRARVARDNGRQQAEVVALFGYKGREFRVKNAFQSCSSLSAGVLRRALDILCDCDRQLKSSAVDDRVLLEQTVIRLLAAGT